MSDPIDVTKGATSTRPVLRVHAAAIEVTSGPDAGRRARIETPTLSREHLRLALSPDGVRLPARRDAMHRPFCSSARPFRVSGVTRA